MDLGEWELLPDEGFLEIHDDGGKKIYSRKYPSESRSFFHMNYFLCPPNPQEDHERFGEIEGSLDQDPAVSQVFFKKMMKEADHQFADMKVESPRSNGSRKGMEGYGPLQFEEKIIDLSENEKDYDKESIVDDDDDDDEGGVMNLWKRGLTGIGAICSFAAATLCIVVLSSGQRKSSKYPQQKNQRLTTLEIYASDKRINQMVRHGNKLGGIPITRAHITVGGYYDAAN